MRTVLLPLVALVGCGPIQIDPAQEYCSDFDPDLTEDDAVVTVVDEEGFVSIHRSPVYRGRRDVLDIDVEIDDRVLLVRETWSERAGDEEICWQPTVDITNLPSGDWEVEWYLETESSPSYSTRFSY